MKKNVCAYVRVSTKGKAQEHSFEFQNAYWNDVLSSNKEFNYVGVYADKGISGGTSIRRPQFMKMIMAAKNGQIDLIYCKSVQRFARNTSELLTYVHELRDIGVAVIFEKENINTLKIDSDIYLTVAAALAEDDLSRYSENVSWSIKDKFSKGEMHIGWRLYGYYVKHAKVYEINPQEAEVVRDIFDKYVQGYSTGEICKFLNNDNIPSPLGRKWCPEEIRMILSNEKYKGDILLQKYYHENGSQFKNNGERDSYYVKNSHKGIVPPNIWELAKERLDKTSRPSIRGRLRATYPFSGIIECGICGKPFIHRISNAGLSCAAPYWRCASGHHDDSRCDSTQIKDSVLKAKFIDAYNKFILSKGNTDYINSLEKQIENLVKEDSENMRLFTNGWISSSDYDSVHNPVVERIKELKTQIKNHKNKNIEDKDYYPITVFDENKVYMFLTKVKVYRWKLEFQFFNGLVIEEQFTNKKRGY